MVFTGNYKIFIQDEAGSYNVCIRRSDNNLLARFDCVYAAEQYAKQIGLKSGYVIKK